ncbi:cobalt-precorrin-6B (C15)-methyltransferase [Halarsenatibacter silvermanii]|uniref:Cobalt-precorrin-6B (C15)-methyltransferase n=2 Tax=Halarsenatibacter silvermanii TaxID=321763 RepID=A0A1G9Q2W7_9FIRM|nr:cobalt-precorrin-6B (C15)-methyltransferase [Halarsenatibacter silvermanii]
MTKREIRAVTLSSLRLAAGHIVWDVGAGSGSLTVEAALMVEEDGKVIAIERQDEGLELIRKNSEKFGAKNIEIVSGEAPEVLEGLAAPDRVFIGGSGGNLAGIIEAADERLKPGGCLVINAVTIDTLCNARRELKSRGYRLEISQVQCARANPLGSYHMFEGLNPVHVICGLRGEKSEAEGESHKL